jgi:hypothetical protein
MRVRISGNPMAEALSHIHSDNCEDSVHKDEASEAGMLLKVLQALLDRFDDCGHPLTANRQGVF